MAAARGMADVTVSPRAPRTADQKAKRLKRSLEREGPGFEFFQAMRLLMRLYPEHAALGSWDDPAREVVRFSVPPSLSFPPSEIARIDLPLDQDEDDADPLSTAKARRTQARMAIRFFGLTGPQGVLPHAYTEHASGRSRVRDTAFRDFLDLFHHRALSLFYRGWERHHTTVPAERGSEDRIQHHLLDLVGAGTEETRKRSTLATGALAFYAGLFAMRTRPAVGLAQLIADYFSVPAEIEQYVGEWQPVQGGGQVNIGGDDLDGRLGASIIGDAVFDPMAMVRLRLGPLTRRQFDAFLPSGEDHETLQQLAHFYADDQVAVSVQLVLAREEIPGAQLSTSGAPALGFGTWLRAKPPVRDADDVHFKLS